MPQQHKYQIFMGATNMHALPNINRVLSLSSKHKLNLSHVIVSPPLGKPLEESQDYPTHKCDRVNKSMHWKPNITFVIVHHVHQIIACLRVILFYIDTIDIGSTRRVLRYVVIHTFWIIIFYFLVCIYFLYFLLELRFYLIANFKHFFVFVIKCIILILDFRINII